MRELRLFSHQVLDNLNVWNRSRLGDSSALNISVIAGIDTEGEAGPEASGPMFFSPPTTKIYFHCAAETRPGLPLWTACNVEANGELVVN